MSSIALVTGGSRGIGLATVRRLLEDGHRVCFCGRDSEAGRAAEVELGEGARFIAADVGREAEVIALVDACTRELGAPRILVNNAGVNARADAAAMSEAEWDAFFAIDLKAAWLCAKHVLPHMCDAGGGAIVNVSSIHAVATLPGFFPYAAAKAGLVGLTRSLALDYGPHGIRVNCVCPGFTDTRLVRDGIALSGEAKMTEVVALGRIAAPKEIASAIAFLASADAGYVTGATLVVDGGLTARRAG